MKDLIKEAYRAEKAMNKALELEKKSEKIPPKQNKQRQKPKVTVVAENI